MYTTFSVQIPKFIEVYFSNQQVYSSNGLYARKQKFRLTSRGNRWEQKNFALRRLWRWSISRRDHERTLVGTLFTGKMNCLVNLTGLSCMLKWGWIGFATFELLNPSKKVRKWLWWWGQFLMISDIPNVSRALKDDYHKKWWKCLHTSLWSKTIWKHPQKPLIIPAWQSLLVRKKTSTMLLFAELQWQWIHFLRPFISSLATYFGLNNSTWDNL